jgi:signal transduction histidine kinase
MTGANTLGRRLAGVIALFSLCVVSVLGITGWQSVAESQRRSLQERLALARAAAAYVDHVMRINMQHLQEVEFASSLDLTRPDPARARDVLRSIMRHSVFESVFLTDAEGHERAGFPYAAHPDRGVPPPVAEALRRGVPVISGVVASYPARRRVVYVVMPLRDGDGKLAATVGGEIDPTAQGLRSALATINVGSSAYMDLVDPSGVVIASTRPAHVAEPSDHGHVLANLIRERRTSVGACHRCHVDKETGAREDEIMAFAPMDAAPWGVTLRQAAAEALAPARNVRGRFVTFGTLLLGLSFLLAWGMARSVVRPIKALTDNAHRIAAGDLSKRVPNLGEDEIGRLGRAFDLMREHLKESLETLNEVNRTLEVRVSERTAELEKLYLELRRKEAIKGELLRKVITAQEEERKRLARELHDETAQLLTALGILVGSAAAGGEAGRQSLEKARVLATKALEGVHALMHALRPSLLDDLGLRSAIREYAERLEERGLSVRVHLVGEERRLPGALETALYRVAQEALTNIARHADASDVEVTVAYQPDRVTIEVADDGKGFDPAVMTAGDDLSGRGLGLLGMRERVELAEGQITIESAPGQGTRVKVTVPIPGTTQADGPVPAAVQSEGPRPAGSPAAGTGEREG